MSGSPARTLEQITEEAKEKGLLVVLSQADELLLDIDNPVEECNYRVIRTMASNGIQVLSSLRTTSKSSNSHYYFRLDTDLEVPERIALQAALGSDGVRETLSLIRYLEGSEISIALFETPEEFKRVQEWRSKR